MSRTAPIARLAGALVLVLGGGLAACSQLGGLDHSVGHGPGAANQPRQQQDPNRPTGTIDPRDASGTPAPPRTLPIPGTAPSPTASGPQGALPDPYANPPR